MLWVNRGEGTNFSHTRCVAAGYLDPVSGPGLLAGLGAAGPLHDRSPFSRKTAAPSLSTVVNSLITAPPGA